MDGTPIPLDYFQTSNYYSYGISISYDGESVYVTMNPGFSFKFSPMALVGYANQQFKGNLTKDYTHGILGTFDGNPFNDLMTPAGVIVPANSTTEVIHYKFGYEWYVKPNESLFNYFGKSYWDYYHPEFKPSFGYEEGQLPPDAEEICGNDPSCLWDLVTTGNVSLANQTRGILILLRGHGEITFGKKSNLLTPANVILDAPYEFSYF